MPTSTDDTYNHSDLTSVKFAYLKQDAPAYITGSAFSVTATTYTARLANV